jgi:hypothetical protein
MALDASLSQRFRDLHARTRLLCKRDERRQRLEIVDSFEPFEAPVDLDADDWPVTDLLASHETQRDLASSLEHFHEAARVLALATHEDALVHPDVVPGTAGTR